MPASFHIRAHIFVSDLNDKFQPAQASVCISDRVSDWSETDRPIARRMPVDPYRSKPKVTRSYQDTARNETDSHKTFVAVRELFRSVCPPPALASSRRGWSRS